MSEGLAIAQRELDQIISAADIDKIKYAIRELICHCEWQERTIAEMSDRIARLERAK